MTKEKKGKYQNKKVYIQAALAVIRDVGVEKLTMRKVAKDLDVSPMAIYKHFKNKGDLLKAVLDEFVAEANVLPHEDLPWDQWIEYVARAMYYALQRDTNWLPLLGSFQIGEKALNITFTFISKLSQAGFTNAQALDAFMSMIHLVVGAVSIQSAFNKGGESVAKDVADNISSHSEPLLALAGKQQVDVSLPILISGLRAELSSNQT